MAVIEFSKMTISDRSFIIPPSRKARPITNDMQTMCDDINRVEPLPVLVSRKILRSYAKELQSQLDRSLMAAICGFSR